MKFHYYNIQDECFQDYKKISMLVSCVKCDGKCWKELNLPPSTCQNNELSNKDIKSIDISKLIDRYVSNKLTKAIIFGGLEPFLQFNEILEFVKGFRIQSDDDIVIYTGYYPDEIKQELMQLKRFPNIIVKFGRYIPNSKKKYDEVLGIELISDNQYAEKIS